MMNTLAIVVVFSVIVLAATKWLDFADLERLSVNAKSRFFTLLESPKNLLIAVLLLVLVDLLAGGIVSLRISDRSLGQQVFLLVLGLSALPAFWTAGWFISILYSSNKRYLLLLDPRWGGHVDLLEAHPDVLGEYTIRGAERLHSKPIPFVGEIYLARDIAPERKEILATWKALADPAEVEKSQKALWSNHKTLDEKLDEWLDAISSLPFLRRSAREEGYKSGSEMIDASDRSKREQALDAFLADNIEEIDEPEWEHEVEDTVEQREDFDAPNGSDSTEDASGDGA